MPGELTQIFLDLRVRQPPDKRRRSRRVVDTEKIEEVVATRHTSRKRSTTPAVVQEQTDLVTWIICDGSVLAITSTPLRRQQFLKYRCEAEYDVLLLGFSEIPEGDWFCDQCLRCALNL
jgi:hypothetical protein